MQKLRDLFHGEIGKPKTEQRDTKSLDEQEKIEALERELEQAKEKIKELEEELAKEKGQ